MYIYVFQVLREVAKPRNRWGPALPENRTGRYASSKPLDEDSESEPSPPPPARQMSYVNQGYVEKF